MPSLWQILLVEGLDARDGVGLDVRCVDQHVVGALDALPTVVAVHGPIAAGDGSDARVAASLLGQVGQERGELGDVAGAGLRVDVAAVHEAVDANGLHAPLGCHGDERLAMALHGVHAAGAHEAHEVQGLAGGCTVVHRADEDLIGLEGAVLDGIVDARKLLEDDAAGANVEVADLGIAHLAIGQAHVLSGCAEGGVRVVGIQAVDERRVGRAHGVVGTLGRQTEAVHDAQQCGKVAVSHG